MNLVWVVLFAMKFFVALIRDDMGVQANSLTILCRISLLEISADVDDDSAFSGTLEALK